MINSIVGKKIRVIGVTSLKPASLVGKEGVVTTVDEDGEIYGSFGHINMEQDKFLILNS